MIAASAASATFEYDGIESAADHAERIMPVVETPVVHAKVPV
jgi:hypothetical protein